MQTLLTTELYWLVLTVLMIALFWVPYIINRLVEHGPWPAIWNPEPDKGPKAQWAFRMMKAHENAVENLVIFAPLVITVHVTGMSTPVTGMACMIYFFARAAHYVVFSMGVPVLRVVTFAIGVYAQLVLALTILGLL